jgi:hypothetical protein
MKTNHIILYALLIIIIGILLYKKSTFGAGCTYDNRQYPEGNVPGSDIITSSAEQNNVNVANKSLLSNFVKNGSTNK